ncbi:hypothetical protein RCC89_04835 [Cytophagaceae bacterium ABcell3]|nr:hypothetical protein RCC89_04835 [Cytophagaceae bacterium ABcell3]
MKHQHFKLYLLFVLFILYKPCTAQQDWGIGIRAGAPTGVTVKRYFGQSSLEGVVGHAPMWFADHRIEHAARRHGNRYYLGDYRGRSGAISLQLRYLREMNFESDQAPGLALYYGAGLYFRSITYYYDMYDSRHSEMLYNEPFTAFGLGPEAIFGMEYTFEELPFISLFLEASLYVEVLGVFHLEPLFGIGARFNF